MENKTKEVHVKIVIDNLEEIKKEIEELGRVASGKAIPDVKVNVEPSKEDESVKINVVRASDIIKIDDNLKVLCRRMKRRINSSCLDEESKFFLSFYLDRIICTANALGVMCATKDLNKRDKDKTMS